MVLVCTLAKGKAMVYILTMGKVVVYWWQNHCIIATTQVLVSLTQPRRSPRSKAQTPLSEKLPCYTPLPGSRQMSQMCSMVWQLINWKELAPPLGNDDGDDQGGVLGDHGGSQGGHDGEYDLGCVS